MPDWSEAGIRREIERLKAARAAAEAFNIDRLDARQRFQREYFLSRMDHDLFWLEKANWPFRNPQFYFGWMSDSLDPSPYITLKYAPPEQRMRAFIRYQQNLVEAARQIRNNLRMPMPLTWLQLGVDAFGGYAAYFRDEVPRFGQASRIKPCRPNLLNPTPLPWPPCRGWRTGWIRVRNIADDRYALGPDLFSRCCGTPSGWI